MKKLLFGLLMAIVAQTSFAQTLEKMQWFNEPEQWEIKDKTLSMFVTPQSDYWRISHYGFTVDNAPFYYATYGTMPEAESAGEYYLNDVMYIGNAEITNYSVQPVYRNDHSIAYYGLNLWSNGSLIQ